MEWEKEGREGEERGWDEKGGDEKGREGKNVLPHLKQVVAAYGQSQDRMTLNRKCTRT